MHIRIMFPRWWISHTLLACFCSTVKQNENNASISTREQVSMFTTAYLYTCQLFLGQMCEIFISILSRFSKTSSFVVQFQKISILPPRKGFCFTPPPPPLRKFRFIFIHYSTSKSLAFNTPLPLGSSTDLPWGGYGFFLQLHNVGGREGKKAGTHHTEWKREEEKGGGAVMIGVPMHQKKH